MIALTPEFFDIFGIAIFTIILLIGIWKTGSKKKLPLWIGYLLATIGVLGLIVDGTIVIKAFLLS